MVGAVAALDALHSRPDAAQNRHPVVGAAWEVRAAGRREGWRSHISEDA
jgi:hypothetical protein